MLRAPGRSFRYAVVLAINVGAFLFGGASAQAIDYSWTGATSTQFNDPTNWSPGTVPGSGDNAVFDTTFANQPNLISNPGFSGIWMTGAVGQNTTISGSGQLITLGVGGTVINGTAGLGILVDNANSSSLTISCDLKLSADQTWRNNSGNVLTISGDINNNNKDLTVDGSGDTIITGVISHAGSLTMSGSGNLTLSGDNTFTGGTTVNSGTLNLAAASGSALASTPSITVNAGGILLLGANDQINNSALMTLAGGTFAKGNFSEGGAASIGLGALNLTSGGSHIDFGINLVGVLNFASFNPNGHNLTIDNWTGTPNSVGNASTDRLIFNADQSGNLAHFVFTDYLGATQLALGGGFFEVTPSSVVPEPTTYLAAFFVLGVVGFEQYRRRRSRRTSKAASIS